MKEAGQGVEDGLPIIDRSKLQVDRHTELLELLEVLLLP
jgi:hypothetical protein